MINTEVLAGITMLELEWGERQRDLIDLISPFIIYSVGKITEKGSVLDENKILDYVKKNFGFSNMPISIVFKVLKRNRKYFEKNNGKYYLKTSLETLIETFERKKSDCRNKIFELSKGIDDFLELNIGKKLGEDKCCNLLLDFFSKYGLDVCGDSASYLKSEGKTKEAYYLGRFIFEIKETSPDLYNSLMDIVKGFCLKTAIYLQGNNDNLIASNYSNITFIYDTPILIGLLGYKKGEQQLALEELHQNLRKRKARFGFFEHTAEEIESILLMYRKSLITNNYSNRTLEGLDEKKYQASDVERIMQTWKSNLKNKYGVYCIESPIYETTVSGNIDYCKVLDDNELKKEIKSVIPSHKEEALDRDVQSLVSISKLRNGRNSKRIEDSIAILVTTNSALIYASDKIYKNNRNKDNVSLAITDNELSAIDWVKFGSSNYMSDLQLICNAYASMEPMPELIEKFNHLLEKMVDEGSINEDLAILLRGDRVIRKELLEMSFDEEISPDSISKLKEIYHSNIIANYKNEEEKRTINEQKKRQEYAISVAANESREIKNKLFNFRNLGVKVIEGILCMAFLWASYVSWGKISMLATILLALFTFLSIASLIKEWKAPLKIGNKFIARIEKWQFEKRKKKYLEVCEGNRENIY